MLILPCINTVYLANSYENLIIRDLIIDLVKNLEKSFFWKFFFQFYI